MCLMLVVAQPVHAQFFSDRVRLDTERERDDMLLRLVAAPAHEHVYMSPDGETLASVESSGIDRSRLRLSELGDGGSVHLLDLSNLSVNWLEWAGDDWILLSVSMPWEAAPGASRRAAAYAEMLSHLGMIMVVNRKQPGGAYMLFDGMLGSVGGISYILPDEPDHVLMPVPGRNATNFGRVNLRTGESESIARGNETTVNWITSGQEPVVRIDHSRYGRHFRVFTRAPGRRGWARATNIRYRDIYGARPDFEWVGAGDNASEIIVRARPDGQEFFGIHRYSLSDGSFLGSVAVRDDFDIAYGLTDPVSGRYIGYAYIDDVVRFVFTDEAQQADYERLRSHFDPSLSVEPVSFSEERWLARVSGSQEPGLYVTFDIETGEVREERRLNPTLSRSATSPVRTITYTARDGVEIEAYLTEPPGGLHPTTPILIYPHGGPELRDWRRFDPVAQFLSMLGYAVIQPNFRGSAGYGREFAERGYREWGEAMQTDLHDALANLAEQGMGDPDRACIIGYSYGGYAALMGALQDPERFQCAVAGAAPTDLRQLMREMRDVGGDVYAYWTEQLGDYRDDREAINAVSPVNLAENLRIPLFMFHGGEDPIVPVSHSENLADEFDDAGVSYELLVVDDMGHDWGSANNQRLIMLDIARFLDGALPLESSGTQGAASGQ
ncbi:MAG: S9 family peptidase [Maricaulis sp.]|jgi:dipeptidyl aminopeptidase/acylaminoacyl peptidase|uniref:alpha/beta hydrolase family protein n=1 Tax=Maricaulis sp. TaxID=1486257 RepID=UPI001B1705DA|nr:alpha/beta fold hydrolase [Maricaulis sp.]MBO6846144.1 S9 family peptidase [Maricaulis sp.]MBO6875979.1 S9 family peptidase [Maricaulis sp.]